MSDPLQKLDRLAAAARREQAPEVDVSWRVGVKIANRGVRAPSRPLIYVMAASVATAVVVGLLAVPILNVLNNPLVAMAQSVSTIQ